MRGVTWVSVRLSLAAALATTLVACGGDPPEPPQPRVQAKHVIVAVDFSGSRSAAALEDSKTLLRLVVDTLRPDERVTLLHVEGRGMQHGNRWSATLPHVRNVDRPTATEQHEIEATVEDIRLAVTKLFDEASILKDRGTDILSTLFEVSDHLAGADDRQPTLLLMSDMIQAGNGISFENLLPSRRWIDDWKASGLVPDLGGLCVSVVGADASTVQGVKIREFWEAYFTAAGADYSIDRYRHSVTRIESLFCDPVVSRAQARRSIPVD